MTEPEKRTLLVFGDTTFRISRGRYASPAGYMAEKAKILQVIS